MAKKTETIAPVTPALTTETTAEVKTPAVEYDMVFSETREAAAGVPHHEKAKLFRLGVPSGKKDKTTGKETLTNERYAWAVSTGQLREGYARKVLNVVSENLSGRANRTPANPTEKAKRALDALSVEERKEILRQLGLGG
jgi:hypothetical protein